MAKQKQLIEQVFFTQIIARPHPPQCLNARTDPFAPASVIDDVQEPQLEPEELEKENNNMYRIIGIIDGHYIVQTPKGLRKVKAIKSNKKNVSDEIKIE